MPTYDLKPCFTGASGHNISRGGCPGYAGGGSALGPIPNGSGEITVPGGQCYSGTYVYKNNLVVGDCDDCETLEIEFIETPDVLPATINVCRIGSWQLENPSGYTGITINAFGNGIRLDASGGANPIVRKLCDGSKYTDTGALQYNFDQGSWGSGSTYDAYPNPVSLCNGHTSGFKVGARTVALSNPCSGAAARCGGVLEDFIINWSAEAEIGTCPGVQPSICESVTSVDFTSAAYYTPSGNCDPVTPTNVPTGSTLRLWAREQGVGSFTNFVTTTGSTSPFKTVNIVNLVFPGGVGGSCKNIEYYYTIEASVGGLTCSDQSPTCLLEVCPAPVAPGGGSFETCNDL